MFVKDIVVCTHKVPKGNAVHDDQCITSSLYCTSNINSIISICYERKTFVRTNTTLYE